MNFDKSVLSQTLSQMIQIPTVSEGDGIKTAQADEFLDFVLLRFKNIAKTCEHRDFTGGIMFIWRAQARLASKTDENAKKPLALMSHFDVVKAEGEWNIPPFEGQITFETEQTAQVSQFAQPKNRTQIAQPTQTTNPAKPKQPAPYIIHGRGAADTKGSLCAILAAVDLLIQEGFKPLADIYIMSSSREEVAGEDAGLMADFLKQSDVRLGLLVDEGGAILKSPMAGVKGEYAMIAMSERSSASLQFSGDDVAIARLTKILKKRQICKSVMPPEVKEMLRRLSQTMSGFMRFAFKNLWLTKGIILKLMPKISAQAAAMVAPEVKITGKLCKIATTCHIDINKCVQKVDNLAEKCGVSVDVKTLRVAPPPTDFNSAGVKFVEETVKNTLPGTLTTPFIIFGGTDARHFTSVCDCVVRFAPLKMNNQIIASVHNANEYIFADSVVNGAKVYYNLIKNYK